VKGDLAHAVDEEQGREPSTGVAAVEYQEDADEAPNGSGGVSKSIPVDESHVDIHIT
jgi:hypothetical protein